MFSKRFKSPHSPTCNRQRQSRTYSTTIHSRQAARNNRLPTQKTKLIRSQWILRVSFWTNLFKRLVNLSSNNTMKVFRALTKIKVFRIWTYLNCKLQKIRRTKKAIWGRSLISCYLKEPLGRIMSSRGSMIRRMNLWYTWTKTSKNFWSLELSIRNSKSLISAMSLIMKRIKLKACITNWGRPSMLQR